MIKAKILAPVGGAEQLKAAVRCGADAVYFGAKGFNARQNADNFISDDMAEAVAYCHERGVTVYVTLNTLVTDGELTPLMQTLDDIASAGADAVIVQDMAVASLVRRRYPSLPMVASTQAVVHNAPGARALERLGFTQAVLARELSLDEIASIRKETDIKLEAFIHGALCMSVSGQCYLSSVIGTRSGNRGLCAQPCRTDFTLNGKPYALSLKDLSAISHIKALEEAGVSMFKIEGRMKRPEYVAASVAACRAALDGGEYDIDVLRSVFSRSGFTDGYLTAKRTHEMFGHRTREDVAATADVLAPLRASYRNEAQNTGISMEFAAHRGEPSALTVSDGLHTASATGAVPEQARTVELTADVAKKSLSQTGGTPYRVDALSASIDPGLSMSVSATKELRRAALAKLAEIRRKPPVYPSTGAEFELPSPHSPAQTSPRLRLRFESAAQAFDADEAEFVIFPVKAILASPELVSRLGGRLMCELPSVCFPEDEAELRRDLASLKSLGVAHALVSSIGLYELAREEGFILHGDSGMNILNSVALEEYRRMGLADATVSFELSMGKIARLSGTLPRGIIGYGYLPLMKLRACPARTERGCGECTGLNTLRDSKNEPFTLMCHQRKYQELLNGVPLYIFDKHIAEVDFITLRFTYETKKEAEEIFRLAKDRLTPTFPRTGGLYFRELQ